ncbi:MAG: hypothetical protein IE884_07230 [Sulfuricurvum sp.]|nr:hypothetical protein [Sulfuricurvum sp.]
MEVSSYIFQNPYSQPFQIGRPDPAMLKAKNEKAQEELEAQQQQSAQLSNTQTQKEPNPLAIKSSALYQGDTSYSKTALSVNAFTTLSKETQRSENIATYANNAANIASSFATA